MSGRTILLWLSMFLLAGCPDEGPAGDDDASEADDDTVDDDDVADDDTSGGPDDDATGDDDTDPTGLPEYPSDVVEAVLLSGSGVCHGEGSPWGYAQNYSMMSIAWRELDGLTAPEIAAALGAYVDSLATPTMLVVMMGGQTSTEPPEPYYPPEKEAIEGYMLNVGSDSVTPDLASEDFQQDLAAFLPLYGEGLRQALADPERRNRVFASIGWLGSYSECHYSASGEPGQTELLATIARFAADVGAVAELPVVFHVSGRHDIAEGIAADVDLSQAMADHHLWFKINGFHCAEPVAGSCLGEDYAGTQAEVLADLRGMGANVGWEPKHPDHFLEASAGAQQYGIDVSLGAGATFSCSQHDEMIGVMSDLLTGSFQPPSPW